MKARLVIMAKITRKYNPTGEELKTVRDLYDGTTVKINVIMMRLKRKYPRWYIRRLAQKMGLARTKEPDWSRQEITYLLDHYHICGYAALRSALKRINGGFARSTTAIYLKAKRLMICKSDQGYTMLGVCALLGVDHHKVRKWVSKGYLKGKPRGTKRKKCQGGDIWFFDSAWLRSFIIRHPEEIDLRRVDKQAFIGILLCNIEDLMTICRCPNCGDEYQRMMNWTGKGTPRIRCDSCRELENIHILDYELGRMEVTNANF
jgi:hypothetical protein